MSKEKYALIGYPLGYSLSPAMHNAFFKKEGIQAEYVSVPLTMEQIGDFINSKKYTGFNVTVPHKESVIPFLDDITESASKIGAVNTVKLVDGRYIGTNTDAPGFALMLKEELELSLQDKNILLVGAGGAAKAITYIALTNKCQSLVFFDKDQEKAKELKDNYANMHNLILYNEHDINKIMPQIDIVVNATPVGMKNGASPLRNKSLCLLKKSAYIIDIIYSPLETTLLQNARALGLKTLNGVGMLAGQGVLAEEYWFGKKLNYVEARDIIYGGL